jgi:hypothetical protein
LTQAAMTFPPDFDPKIEPIGFALGSALFLGVVTLFAMLYLI